MPGRRGKPLQLHLIDGKSRLTKAEIEFRRENEIHIGTHDFKMPSLVAGIPVAKKKWEEVIGLYLDVDADFVSTSDSGIIERYCLAYAEYVALQNARDEIVKKGWSPVKTAHAIEEMNLENSINKKNDMLIKLEDRLFLNPLAKVRNVPKKESTPKEDCELKQMFGD